MRDVIEMARDQGLPETEVAGVFIVNQDDLGRFADLVRADALADHSEQPLGMVAEQHKPYRPLQNNGSKYFGASWDKADEALDKMAENARELGLDYEPVPENFMDALKFDVAMRDAMVANLVREGIGKHRARELADHFIGLAAKQPTVPDALTIADKESFDYHEGWNDCRALMLEMRKP